MAMQIIRGGRLLDARAHTAEPRDILIDGDTIREIGQPGMKAPDGAKVIDGTDTLMHAGLINSHTHGHSNLSKSAGDRWTLELLLAAGPWISGDRTPEDKYLTTIIGAAEMILKGCTAVYDLFIEFPTPSVDGLESVGRAYADAGMRAVVTAAVMDKTLYEAMPGLIEAMPEAAQSQVRGMKLAPAEASLACMRDVLHKWPLDRGQVRPAIAPSIPIHCTEEFLLGCKRLADEFGCGVHSHVHESKVQAVVGKDRWGTTATSHLDKLGLLSPRFTVAHGVWLDEEDMRRLAGNGSHVAHNPGSNMLLGNGIARVKRMRELGVNVGIGTDSATCSDNLNMYGSMHLASLASKVLGPDTRRWLETAEVFEFATEGSARLLGFERIGRLAEGYKADVVFLDLNHPNWIPFNDPTNQMIHVEDGTSVRDVMVGGKFVVKDRKLLTVDLADLRRKAQAALERLAKTTHRNKTLFDKIAPIVDSVCPTLARRPYHIDRFAMPGFNEGRYTD
ncbi:MAG: amidohydrolase family protein [Alphaproteobacteria bacterium]